MLTFDGSKALRDSVYRWYTTGEWIPPEQTEPKRVVAARPSLSRFGGRAKGP
jgi:hypothetical protein